MSKTIVNPNPFGRSGKNNGLWFFYDDEISIKWDCDKSFTVWNKDDIVNNFTVEESMTPKQAEKTADEWLADVLQEEKLRHADDMEFQFESPDLFKM